MRVFIRVIISYYFLRLIYVSRVTYLFRGTNSLLQIKRSHFFQILVLHIYLNLLQLKFKKNLKDFTKPSA